VASSFTAFILVTICFYRSLILICLLTKAAAMEITCGYGFDPLFAPIQRNKSFSCNVEHIEVLTPWEVIIKTKENDTKVNEKVNAINFHHQKLNFIPAGLENVFHDLKGLLFESCDIHRVDQSNFKSFTELEGLWLRGNPQLDTLEKGLFDYNLKLTFLNFHNNNLRHIDANLFKSLNSLNYVVFATCGCIENVGISDGLMLPFKNEFQRKCQNEEAMQRQTEQVVQQSYHKQLSDEVQEIKNQLEAEFYPLRQKARSNKIRLSQLNKVLTSFAELSINVQELKKLAAKKG